MKLIKRLVGIVLVLLLAAVLFLVPSSINPNEQLKNVQANTSWESMIEPTLNNANATAQGVSTEVSLNSVQLNQLLKSSLTDSDNQELLNGLCGRGRRKLSPSVVMVELEVCSCCFSMPVTQDLGIGRMPSLALSIVMYKALPFTVTSTSRSSLLSIKNSLTGYWMRSLLPSML